MGYIGLPTCYLGIALLRCFNVLGIIHNSIINYYVILLYLEFFEVSFFIRNIEPLAD